MPFTPVPHTHPIQYTWSNGGTAELDNRITAVRGVATGGVSPATRLTAEAWATAIDPRGDATGAPPRPPGVNARARYNTLGAWVLRENASTLLFAQLAESVRLAESAAHALPTATPTARLAHLPAGTTNVLAINSDMTGDLCWLIVAMKLCPELAVAIRIGATEKHLRFYSTMIGQLVGEGLSARTLLITGPTPPNAPVPVWATGSKTTHWHAVQIARDSLPGGTIVESCLSTSRRVFEAAAEQALDEQRSVADVACELFKAKLTDRLTPGEKTAIETAIQGLTQAPGCLSTHAGYILVANRVEEYNHQHNTTPARLNAVTHARADRRVVTFGRPPPGGGGNHIDLYTHHARTDQQRTYFWSFLKATMRQLGRDVVIVGGRSGTFDIAYHSGEEPTGGGLCWDIAGAPRRDPEVDRLQQQAGPGGNSGLSLASLAAGASTRGTGDSQVGDIAAKLTELLWGGGPGLLRGATFAVGLATTTPGADSLAMRNAEMGRAAFQALTQGRMRSDPLVRARELSAQTVSERACSEANRARTALPGARLPHPSAAPKPSPHATSFRCPVCDLTEPLKAKYRLHRIWKSH